MSLVIDALGKETWGGVNVGDGPTVGLGLVGWDSLEIRLLPLSIIDPWFVY